MIEVCFFASAPTTTIIFRAKHIASLYLVVGISYKGGQERCGSEPATTNAHHLLASLPSRPSQNGCRGICDKLAA